MEVTLEVRNRLVRVLCLMTALVWMMVPSLQAGTQFGTVYTRAPVLNPATGAQIWSEYDPGTGEIVRDIADASGEYDPTQVAVISAEQYRGYTEHYETLNDTFRDPDTNETPNLIYTRAEYESSEFRTLDDEAIDKPALGSTTTHVAVRPQSVRYLNNPDELILAEYPVDPEYHVFAGVFSLLVDNLGSPLHTSSNRIGIKAAFLSDASGNVISPEEYPKRGYDDQVHGPVPYVQIDGPMNSQAASAEDGSFRLAWYDLPCPLVSYMIDGWSVAKFQSRRFNPKLNGSPDPYYLRKPYTVFCLPQVQIIPFLGPYPYGMGEHSVSPMKTDFVVDTMALSGTANMARLDGSMIEVEETTRYSHQDLAAERALSDYYDFDGDDTHDQVVEGYWREETDADGEVIRVFDTENLEAVDQSLLLQGVYLSSGSRVPGQDDPDFTRALDWQSNFQHEGMVDAIGLEDLKNTDMYVFRLADGKLISERLGLSGQEGNWNADLGVDQEGSSFFYHNYLRGYWGDVGRMFQARTTNFNNFSEWQATSGINPDLHERKSDHLKPGDRVELLAVNRATGYVGTTQTTMQAPGSAGDGGYLSWNIDPIRMQPPELKIWVERDYDIQAGLEKGEIRQDQIIGYEGAALSSDRAVVVYTDWRKPDGTGLPLTENGDEADYGYTGRIAYLNGDKSIAPAGSYGIAQFAIKPGKHMQVLRLPGGPAANQHLYIQVSGEPESGRPVFTNFNQSKTADFSSTGVHTGKLEPRPDRFVPFKVPVFDEKATEEQRQIYRRLKEENPDLEYTRPKPVYKWVYRPDFQYSIYGLDVKELASYEEEGGEGSDLLANDNPVIASSDDLVSLLYNLDITEYVPLDYFNSGEEKELIFALGEQEVKATLNEESELVFDNIDHLVSLDPEDYLTIQLYTNNDAGNVLWEYAFRALTLFPQRGDSNAGEANTIILTADQVAEGPQALTAFLTGSDSEPQRLTWSTVGQGSVAPNTVVSAKGIFPTELNLSTTAGSSVTAVANLDNSNSLFHTPTFRTVAGTTHTIQAQSSGQTTIGGLGEVEVVLELKDRFGNSVADGTQVSVLAPGLAVDGDGITTDGETSFRFKGQVDSGDIPVEFSVDNVVATQNISVHDVELSFPNLSNVNVNVTKSLEIQATSDYGSLAGLDIDVAVHRGKLGTKRVTLNDQGSAIVQYSAGEFPGFAQLSALVAGTTKVHTEKFFVIRSGGYLERNVLVTDGSGSIDIDGTTLNYGDTTNLVVNAQPGEVVSASLADIFRPPVYALQDFSLGLQGTSGSPDEILILDMSGGIDATGYDTTKVFANTPNGIGWRLGQSGRIDVPSHDRTGNLESAGVNLWVNVPEASQGEATTILDWDDFGLRLLINQDNHLVLAGRFSGTEQTVVSDEPVQPGRWHQIAAHFHSGALKLGVDGKVKETPVGAQLDKLDSAAYAIRIQSPDASSLNVAGLKVYDWQGEAKLRFGNGAFDGTATANAQGVAKLPLQSSPSQVAYTRAYQSRDVELLANAREWFFPNAYANTAGTDECISSFDPVPPDAPDPVISEAKRFMEIALECFVKPRVDQARINYETSEGLFNVSVALVKREAYENMYGFLKAKKHQAIIFANCLDAVVTGGNASAVGATCDFITGMLAIGDIRDLLFQAWHYHVGDRNEYDPLVANLAAIGLLADGAQLIPGAQGAGVVVNAITTSFKQVAKLWRSLGEVGQRASRLVGAKLGRIVKDESKDIGAKIDAIEVMLPFAEITASVALIYQDEPRLFRFLTETISSPQTLDRMIDWTKRYLEKLESEIIAQRASPPVWLESLVPAAYAASSEVRSKFVNQLRAVLNLGDGLSPGATTGEIADAFNESLEVFLRKVDEVDNPFDEIPDDMKVLSAFMVAQKVGGRESIEALANMRHFSTLGLGEAFTREKFVEAVALLPLPKMTAGMSEVQKDALERELRAMFRKMGTQSDGGFPVAKGAQHQFLSTLNRNLAENGNEVTEAFEVRTEIFHIDSDASFSFREYDEVIRIDGEAKNLEMKGWSASYLDAGLRRSLGITDAATNVEGRDRIGQMLSDIVAFRNNGDVFNTRWEFSPELAEAGFTKSDISDRFLELVKKDPVIQANIQRSIGINDPNPATVREQWEEFLDVFEPGVREDLFNISEYEHIKSQLGL